MLRQILIQDEASRGFWDVNGDQLVSPRDVVLLAERINQSGTVIIELGTLDSTDPESISQLGDMRKSFLKDFLDSDYPPASRQLIINQITIPKLQSIIDGNYHNGVRMNAVVLLGLLNEVEGNSRVLPLPSTRAYPVLVSIVTGPNYPAFLKVGALAGVQRHSDTNRHDPNRVMNWDNIKTECTAIMENKGQGQD